MGHLAIEELLSLRDGTAVAPTSAAHHAGCAECLAEVARLGALRDGLRALPPLPPSPELWARVIAAVEPPVTVAARRSRLRLMVAAAAASAAFAVGVALVVPPAPAVAPATTLAAAARGEPSLADLMTRSQQLESVLASLEARPRITSARSAGAIAELEDGIALVDYHLAQGDATLDAVAQRALWRKRVELMESLVTVRYTGERADSI